MLAREHALFLAGRSSVGGVQTPLHTAACGHVEKDKAVENGQFTVVDAGEECSSELELPVELEVGHGHGAARQKGGPAGLEPDENQNPANQFDDATEPELGADLDLVVGQYPENLLHPVHREHESGHDSQKCIGMVRIVAESCHLSLLAVGSASENTNMAIDLPGVSGPRCRDRVPGSHIRSFFCGACVENDQVYEPGNCCFWTFLN